MSEKSVIQPLMTRSGEPYSVVPPPLTLVETFSALKLIAMPPCCSSLREHPRSHRIYCVSDQRRMFSGFRSRWQILWRYSSACAMAIWQVKSMSQSSCHSLPMSCSKLPYLQYGVTSMQLPRSSSQKLSTSCKMYSEFSIRMFLAYSSIWLRYILFTKMLLTAYIFPSYLL